jgi:hypothetical protein
MWATLGVAVIAIALGVWVLAERSGADDAKADLQAREPATTTQAQQPTTTQPTTVQQPRPAGPTQTADDRQGVGAVALAAAAAALGAARRALNESQAEVDELESDVDKANAEAEQAQKDAEKAEEDAASASESQTKQQAQADETDAKRRQFRATADAAVACARATIEIVGDIPSAPSLDDGLETAAGEVTALVPKCKESIAAAGR